jgi:N-acyl-phosphatidylethanolamine-hydrolysing phospholipase D
LRARRGSALCAALAIALGSAAGAADGSADGDGALGPAPRGPDGRFQNFDGPKHDTPTRVVLPFFARRLVPFLRDTRGLPEREPDPAAGIAAAAGPSATWISHASVLVRHDGVSYLTDPIWSGRAGPGGLLGPRRFSPPPFPIAALPRVDFVLISHSHYDHLDLPSLEELRRRQPGVRFFVPLGTAETLRGAGIDDAVELDWGERTEIGGVTVHCLPSRHWSARTPFDENRSLWASWAVTGPERRVFFAGDTGTFAGFATIGRVLGPFDLAVLPIGAYEPVAMMQPVHLNPEEAVAAAVALGAQTIVPIHYGTFDLTDEPLGEPPRRFRAALAAAGIAEERGRPLRLGETRAF